MKLKLTKRESIVVTEAVKRVFETGETWEAEKLHHPAGAIIKTIESIEGVEKEGDFSSNGWDWDWWQNFTYDEKSFTLFGSGHHGGHSFYIADE
jgi:hypothetical protein